MLLTFYLLFIGLHITEGDETCCSTDKPSALSLLPATRRCYAYPALLQFITGNVVRKPGVHLQLHHLLQWSEYRPVQPLQPHAHLKLLITQIIPFISSSQFLFFFSYWDSEESSTGDAEDEVTYSTVVHSKTTTTTTTVTHIGEKTEYATIRVNQ
ncbi:hypothetical protein MHYP_G00050330 [Metynnis hypsauchen]